MFPSTNALHQLARNARPAMHAVGAAALIAMFTSGHVLAAPSPAPSPAPSAAPNADSGAAPVAVQLAMREFAFLPANVTVPAGQPVQVALLNSGVIPHDLVINAPGMPAATQVMPGQTQTIMVQFAQPGTFAIVCTIPGHADAGMKGTLTVIAAPVSDGTTVSAPALGMTDADATSSPDAATPAASTQTDDGSQVAPPVVSATDAGGDGSGDGS